jgi:hypothetical protein
MRGLSVQAPRAVVLIRPHRFQPNPHTRDDNAFQGYDQRRTSDQISDAAYAEATCLAQRLTQAGVRVHLFEDETVSTPDSVFPNNWLSTHSGGRVAVYPMYSPSRQRERRSDVVEMLKAEYRVQEVIDYSGLERDGIYLEGTGAMVIDHIDRVVYAVRSRRTNEVALERFCAQFNYEPLLFDAVDSSGRAIYHTNVLMCIGTEFAMIGLSAITDPTRRAQVRRRLEETGRAIIDLSPAQLREFAGNAIELTGSSGRLLAISSRAMKALSPNQLSIIEESAIPLAFDVPTIELAGGSVRCMIAGVHLAPRDLQPAGDALPSSQVWSDDRPASVPSLRALRGDLSTTALGEDPLLVRQTVNRSVHHRRFRSARYAARSGVVRPGN